MSALHIARNDIRAKGGLAVASMLKACRSVRREFSEYPVGEYSEYPSWEYSEYLAGASFACPHWAPVRPPWPAGRVLRVPIVSTRSNPGE